MNVPSVFPRGQGDKALTGSKMALFTTGDGYSGGDTSENWEGFWIYSYWWKFNKEE